VEQLLQIQNLFKMNDERLASLILQQEMMKKDYEDID